MGNTVSISRIDAFKSASGEEQCVVYTTTDSRTCTLRVSVGVDSASVSLGDYTFDREGTGVEIRISGFGTVRDLRYWGNVLRVVQLQYPGCCRFEYGYRGGYSCAVLAMYVLNGYPGGHRQAQVVLVTHMYETPDPRLAVLVVPVWYDVGKCRFIYNLTGPSLCSSELEIQAALWKAIHFLVPNSAGQQTTITGLINNTGGPVYGHLNGSIFNFITNVFNLNCK